MSVAIEDRPREQVKEEVIDILIMNYSHAVISSEAFERRLDQVMEAQTNQALLDLVADLDMQADADYQQAKHQKLGVDFEPSTSRELEEDKMLSILSSNERKGRWRVPAKLSLLSILGEHKLDFSEAVFQHATVTIRTYCLLGANRIVVPEGVNVIMRSFSIMGKTDNQVPSTPVQQAPTIIVEGWVCMGEITAGIKRTLKERFVAFANQLKRSIN